MTGGGGHKYCTLVLSCVGTPPHKLNLVGSRVTHRPPRGSAGPGSLVPSGNENGQRALQDHLGRCWLGSRPTPETEANFVVYGADNLTCYFYQPEVSSITQRSNTYYYLRVGPFPLPGPARPDFASTWRQNPARPAPGDEPGGGPHSQNESAWSCGSVRGPFPAPQHRREV
jgi:hypothetical protein